MIFFVHHDGAAFVFADKHATSLLTLGELGADEVALKKQFAIQRFEFVHTPAQKGFALLERIESQYHFAPNLIANLFGGPSRKGGLEQVARKAYAAANDRPLGRARFHPASMTFQ